MYGVFRPDHHLPRAAIGGFLQAAREVRDKGTFEYAQYAASFAEIEALLEKAKKA